VIYIEKEAILMNLKKTVFPLAAVLVLFLSSCLSVTTDMTLRDSGAGRLQLDYRLNKMAAGIQKDSLKDRNLIPLPVNEQDFVDTAALVPGITLRNYSYREDSEYIYISSQLDFSSTADLTTFLGFPVVLDTAGGTSRLVMRLFEQEEPVSPETRDILASLFADDSLDFRLTLPGAVTSTSHGSVEGNGRTVAYTVPIPEVYSSSSFIWTVEW